MNNLGLGASNHDSSSLSPQVHQPGVEESHPLVQKAESVILHPQVEPHPADMSGIQVKPVGEEPEIAKIKEYAENVLTPNQARMHAFMHPSIPTAEEGKKFLEEQSNETFLILPSEDGKNKIMMVKLNSYSTIANKIEIKDDKIIVTTPEGHRLVYKNWDQLSDDLGFKGHIFNKKEEDEVPLLEITVKRKLSPEEELKLSIDQLVTDLTLTEARGVMNEKESGYLILKSNSNDELYTIIVKDNAWTIRQLRLDIKEDRILVRDAHSDRATACDSIPELFEKFNITSDLLPLEEQRPVIDKKRVKLTQLSQEDQVSTIRICFDRGEIRPELYSKLVEGNFKLDKYNLLNCKFIDINEFKEGDLQELFNKYSTKTLIIFDKSKNKIITAAPTYLDDPRYLKTTLSFDPDKPLSKTLVDIKESIETMRRDTLSGQVDLLVKTGKVREVKNPAYLPSEPEPGIIYVKRASTECSFTYLDPLTATVTKSVIDIEERDFMTGINAEMKTLQRSQQKAEKTLAKLGISKETQFPLFTKDNFEIKKSQFYPYQYELRYEVPAKGSRIKQHLNPADLPDKIDLAHRSITYAKITLQAPMAAIDDRIYYEGRLQEQFKDPVHTLIYADNDLLKKFSLYKQDPESQAHHANEYLAERSSANELIAAN